jgi:hypothetical protein
MVDYPQAGESLTEQLPSGNHRLVCAECGDVIIAATENEAIDTPCRCHQLRQPVRYIYVLELTCSLCSRPVASIALPSPTARLVLLRSVRCQTCGGAAIAGHPSHCAASGSKRAPDVADVFRARNTAAPPEESPAVAMLLPVAAIDSSPLNPRKHFDDEDMQRLADSLATDGLLRPIVVTPAATVSSSWPANVVGVQRSG